MILSIYTEGKALFPSIIDGKLGCLDVSSQLLERLNVHLSISKPNELILKERVS